MAALTIAHYPNAHTELLCFPEIHVDIHKSVKKRLHAGEELTHAKAISILTKVKWISGTLSFISKPVFVIASACVVVILGMMLAPIAIGLIAIALLIAGISIKFIRDAVSHLIGVTLPQLSKSLAEESAKAAEYLQKLRADPNLAVRFEEEQVAPPHE